jgi:hypothetical protein
MKSPKSAKGNETGTDDTVAKMLEDMKRHPTKIKRNFRALILLSGVLCGFFVSAMFRMLTDPGTHINGHVNYSGLVFSLGCSVAFAYVAIYAYIQFKGLYPGKGETGEEDWAIQDAKIRIAELKNTNKTELREVKETYQDGKWKAQLRTITGPCMECGRNVEHYNVDDAGFWTDGVGRGSSKRFAICFCGTTERLNLLPLGPDEKILKIMPLNGMDICPKCGIGKKIWGEVREIGSDRFVNTEFYVNRKGKVMKLLDVWFMCSSCIDREGVHIGTTVDSLAVIALKYGDKENKTVNPPAPPAIP